MAVLFSNVCNVYVYVYTFANFGVPRVIQCKNLVEWRLGMSTNNCVP